MPKSTITEIVAAMTAVNALDKRGKLAVLRELQRQGLEPNVTNEPIEEKEEKE